MSGTLSKRADRIAHCRNLFIDAVAEDSKYKEVDYIPMADMDGLLTPEKIAQCWEVDEPWDVITANQLGQCYDIWVLSHPYWNPIDWWEQKGGLENILSDKVAQNIAVTCKQAPINPRSDLIEVESAFGGLGTTSAMRSWQADMLGQISWPMELMWQTIYHSIAI